MFRRAWAVFAMTALLLSGTAAAQSPGAPRPGTIELGGFGQWTWFDENAGRRNAGPKDGFGYGARVGVFLPNRPFQLEADGYYSPQDRELTGTFCCTGAEPTEIRALAFALRLNYNAPVGNLMGRQSQFIIGYGAVLTSYKFRGGTEAEDNNSTLGLSGLAGLRIGVANRAAIRLDGVIDYMPNHVPDVNTNLHARAGLSLLLGGARVPPPPPPPPPPEVRMQAASVRE